MTDVKVLKEAILNLPCTVFIMDEFFNLLLEEGEFELPGVGEIKKIGEENFDTPGEGSTSFTVDFEAAGSAFRVNGTFVQDPSNMYIEDKYGYQWDIDTLIPLVNNIA